MSDETPPRSAGSADRSGHSGVGGGEQSPLQARAAFLGNRSWESVVSYNRGACARGGASHGFNSGAGGACAEEWERLRRSELTLLETFDALRAWHRKAPFLFFNGNTFAELGRQIVQAVLGDLPAIRKKEAGSAAAHYIAGVLDREAMVGIIEGLCRTAELTAGVRVQTLKGTLGGVVVRVLEDGRISWRPDGAGGELIALPESLRAEEKGR